MKRTGYIFVTATAVLIFIWLVPSAWRLVTAMPETSPFTLYSATIHDFTTMDVDAQGNYVFTDTHGRRYAGPGAERVQALFYCDDLASRGLLPDTIEGRRVTLDVIERGKFILSLTPDEQDSPRPRAYLLMESAPGRGKLAAAKEGFYGDGDGAHVIRLADNTEDEAKSAAFTAAMRRAGFVFPIDKCSGNPDAKKDYDEGYMMTDAAGALYHMKQQRGRCAVRRIDMPRTADIERVQMVENADRRIRAIVCSANHSVYVVDSLYRVHDTGVAYDAATEDMLVIGDICYMTIKVGTLTGERFYAVSSRDYRLRASMQRPYATAKPLVERVMPLQLIMSVYNSRYIMPRLKWMW